MGEKCISVKGGGIIEPLGVWEKKKEITPPPREGLVRGRKYI